MIAHATIAKAFDLPVVMTTSAETGTLAPLCFHASPFSPPPIPRGFNGPRQLTCHAFTSTSGPNGPLPGEIRKLYPDAPIISRHGEVNAWDNKDFREAVRAANKSQIIVGGIVTEVCTTFLALSLREAGYSVWANVEASGTMSTIARDTGNDRMKDAGVHLVSLFAIFGELMRHWGNVPGGKELFPWLDRFVPQVSFVVRQHQSAIKDGEIAPGEEDLNEGRKIDW